MPYRWCDGDFRVPYRPYSSLSDDLESYLEDQLPRRLKKAKGCASMLIYYSGPIHKTTDGARSLPGIFQGDLDSPEIAAEVMKEIGSQNDQTRKQMVPEGARPIAV